MKEDKKQYFFFPDLPTSHSPLPTPHSLLAPPSCLLPPPSCLLPPASSLLPPPFFHMIDSPGKRLEQYTIKRPHEVLLVTIEVNGEEDQIAIFKGFSSSLVRPTAYDPDVPIVPDDASILRIDLLASPYNPNSPRYIQQGLSWETMQALLSEVKV